ncbi:hypothetical protein BC941DRAFT_455428 [Chlamydoabsidia padenii]|nr:hypothetical protein BC941DRAFT_455428 [Chlamydoabsidia padenii]
MLSHPPFSQQPQLDQQLDHHHQEPQHYHDDYDYLSSSLPLPSQQQQRLPPSSFATDFITDAYDPHLFDDVCIPEFTSSSLPLDEHDDWFRFPSSTHMNEENLDMKLINIDGPPNYQQNHSEGMPTIDEIPVPTNTSMPPPPPLSQSFSPQSDMSMTSPQAQQHHQQGNRINNNQSLGLPFKGHRRRRSSSLPSIFYSGTKKQMVDHHNHHHHHHQYHLQHSVHQSLVPPLFEASRSTIAPDMTYSPQQNIHDLQHQLSPPQSMVLPLESTLSSQQPSLLEQQLAPPPAQQQPPYTKPLPIQIQRNPASHPRHAAPVALDQHQLDEKLRHVNFNDITVAELKDLLRKRNLSVAGRKAELTNRLYNEQQRLLSSKQPPSSSSDSPMLSQHRQSSLPIQQLTHRLSDLGFQHHHPVFPPNQQQQPNSTTTIPVPLPQQQQQQQQQPNPLQHQDNGDAMSQFYNFLE